MKNKAIIWREFNRDIKSSKILMMYLSVSLITFYIYYLNKNFIDYAIALISGIMLMSVYTAIYGMNNIAVILSLPVSIRNMCLARTAYVITKILVITILNFLFIYLMSFIGIINIEVHLTSQCYVLVLGLFSAASIFYGSLLIIFMIKKKTSKFLFMIISGCMGALRNLIIQDISIKNTGIVVVICLLLVFFADVRLKGIESEEIITRWT